MGQEKRSSTMTGLGLGDSDDESLRALNCILEAWEAGASTGVKPEMMAYAAIYTALSDLVSSYGEDAVADLAGGLVERVRSGEFTLYRVRQ
jgi:hypothetical protein